MLPGDLTVCIKRSGYRALLIFNRVAHTRALLSIMMPHHRRQSH